ncbi:hypothetical protein [Microlunatus speluncae]|uniref:hypothetical protein n=1 Tax=Microlunatus speluncae TaxID=2594267 RepID=UPI0012667AA3|nr:hypothetical protein [Microlunatus speluncae]
MATVALIADPTRRADTHGARSRRPSSRRRSLGSARQALPGAQPRAGVAGPRVRQLDPAVARSCRISTTVPIRDLDFDWRLTRRGTTVIMVIGLVIAAAALTVIGATVARVTADDYQPATQTAVR